MKLFTPVAPAALLAPGCTYDLSGDWLTFHLALQVLDAERVAAQQWAVQLWASPVAESAAAIKVAELALAPANLLAAPQCSGTVPALPPAGSSPCRLTLVLVAGSQGLTDLHHSLELCADYIPLQPRLEGAVQWSSDGASAQLHIDSIANPRSADNLSGTLALEVWSLAAAYQGGSWHGEPVASVVLGQLSGQCVWAPVQQTLHIAPASASSYLTLMLREWTPCGYLTRDFRTLAAPAPAVVEPVAVVEVVAAPRTHRRTRG